MYVTVGLRVIDSVYRIIALFILVVSGMGLVFHLLRRHGDGGGQCTMRSAYILLSFLQLL